MVLTNYPLLNFAVCEPVSMATMALSGASQIAAASAQDAAVQSSNAAKLKAHQRATEDWKIQANLDNVQFLNDVQEQDAQQDRTYQALLDQWSSDDLQLKQIFAKNDFEIEDALIKMHEGSYAGTQTGASAARMATKSAKEAGYRKARAIHNKMMATDEVNMRKGQAFKEASDRSRDLFMDVAFAPVHGRAPAKPHLDKAPSKAGLFLGLASTGLQGYKDFKANTAPDVTNTKTTTTQQSAGRSWWPW